jgi:hypothetical protein
MPNCLKCQVELTDENWFPSQRAKNSKICKKCNTERGNEWKRNHPESQHEYSQQYYKTHPGYNIGWCRESRIKIRAEMIEAYGGKCSACGIDNPVVLDIDHKDNNGRADRKRGMWGWRLYRWLKKNNYPTDNFQLLCRNCNWIKHMETRKK